MTQAANLAALSSYIRASAAGLIGIGTANPNEKVEIVNGNLRFTGNQSIIFQNNTGASQAAGAISFKNGAGSQKSAIGSYYNIPAEGNIEFLNGSTTNLVLDPFGYLGLNVTPSTWGTSSGSVSAFQLSQGGALSTSINGVDLSYNNYNNSITNSTYIATSYATIFRQTVSGQFQWLVAPSGTQDTSISYNQALTLDNNGNMALAGSPYTWPATWKNFQIGSPSQTTNSALSFVNTGVNGSIYWNGYAGASYDTYAVNGFANKLTVSSGQYNFYVSAFGSAAGAITFTPAMTLSTAKKLSVQGGIAVPSTSTTLSTIGGSLSFLSSSSSYLTLPTNAGTLGSTTWTVECWWKSNGTTQSNYACIIQQNLISPASAATWAFKVNNVFSSQNAFTFTWGNINDVVSNVNVNDGNWHHLAAVKGSDGLLRLYVDGVQAGTTGNIGIYSTFLGGSGTITMGSNPRDSTYANGYVTNLRTVSGTAVYTADFIPPTAALSTLSGTAQVLYNVASSAAYITDTSGNAFNATSTGVTYSTLTPLHTAGLTVNGGVGVSGGMILGGPLLINYPNASSYTAGVTAIANFTNFASSAMTARSPQIGYAAQLMNMTQTTAAVNNATVAAFRFLDSNGTQFGNSFICGHVYINVQGASGANMGTYIYTLAVNGNGTTNATFTAASSSIRGTNPVSSIALANDGGSGSVLINITYINNSGVVSGTAGSQVAFVGMAS
jgi:hypothetical protein